MRRENRIWEVRKKSGGNKSKANRTSGGEDTQKEGAIIEGEW